jgi:heat shock protein HtpX
VSPAWRNGLQSTLLLLAMGGLWALVGWLLAGLPFMFLMLAGGLVILVAGLPASSRLVLALYGARPLLPMQAPGLYSIMGELARHAGLSKIPALYYVPSGLLNAFSVGSRQDAVVVLTDGLVRNLSWRELAGVLAHEISHVRHNDIWVMALADLVSRMTHMLSLLGWLLLLLNLPLLLITGQSVPWLVLLVLLLAPNVSALMQLALSRQREYEADRGAATLTRDPQGLASALLRLDSLQGNWLSQLLLPGRRAPDPSLLRSHPPTDERVRRLLALNLPEAAARDFETGGRPGNHLADVPVTERRPRWHWFGGWY